MARTKRFHYRTWEGKLFRATMIVSPIILIFFGITFLVAFFSPHQQGYRKQATIYFCTLLLPVYSVWQLLGLSQK